jgi:hypothetical protein
MKKHLLIITTSILIQSCLFLDEQTAPCVFGYNGNGSFHYQEAILTSENCKETTQEKCDELNEKKSESYGMGISSGYKWLEGRSCGSLD